MSCYTASVNNIQVGYQGIKMLLELDLLINLTSIFSSMLHGHKDHAFNHGLTQCFKIRFLCVMRKVTVYVDFYADLYVNFK